MLRIFYIVAAIFSLFNGLWMFFYPLSWYNDLPAAVPDTGPYNGHFIRDLGVAFAVVGLAFGWCTFHPKRCREVHIALTIFFTGHALIHVMDLLKGTVPHSRWLLDLPAVFLPCLIMIVLALPPVWKKVST